MQVAQDVALHAAFAGLDAVLDPSQN
jgi:hypothetical protein